MTTWLREHKRRDIQSPLTKSNQSNEALHHSKYECVICASPVLTMVDSIIHDRPPTAKIFVIGKTKNRSRQTLEYPSSIETTGQCISFKAGDSEVIGCSHLDNERREDLFDANQTLR